MYTSPQVILPNHYQLDQIPYLRMDIVNLQSNLPIKRMQTIRNLTHKHATLFSKIFTFFPKIQFSPTQQQPPIQKLTIFTQLPIMTLQNLTYLITQLKQKQIFTQMEWNCNIQFIENCKKYLSKSVNQIFNYQYQIKIINMKNVMYYVYYDIKADCFRVKVGFKVIGFQVAGFMEKKQVETYKYKNQFVIKNQKLSNKLKQKMLQKLSNCFKRNYQQKFLNKYDKKFQQFYQRQLKHYDQYLLQLKLSHNFNLLRSKIFLPIKFIDQLTKQILIQPIISNKNKNCMYGHFSGYNSSSIIRLANTSCCYCGVQIKQMQQNNLLMYLRENIFNPGQRDILYCPQWNRWKILQKIDEQQLVQNKLSNMKLISMPQQNNRNTNKDNDNKIDQQKQNNADTQQKQQPNKMKNQQSEQQQEYMIIKQSQPETQIKYTNYMHLCLTIKNMYPVTKNRVKIMPTRQVQYIYYVYTLDMFDNYKNINKNKQNNTSSNTNSNISTTTNQLTKYYKQFQLKDPARGKYCTHLQFADLRLFYKNSKTQLNYTYKQTIYICPICNSQIKDSQLMYLKQTLVILKYIKKLLQPQQQQFMNQIQNNNTSKKIDKKSIKIIINNVQQRIFIQYILYNNNQNKKQWKEIDKLYPTLIDPYLHFSEYQLGLHKKNRKLDDVYNLGQNQQSESENFQREWYGIEKDRFSV